MRSREERREKREIEKKLCEKRTFNVALARDIDSQNARQVLVLVSRFATLSSPLSWSLHVLPSPSFSAKFVQRKPERAESRISASHSTTVFKRSSFQKKMWASSCSPVRSFFFLSFFHKGTIIVCGYHGRPYTASVAL